MVVTTRNATASTSEYNINVLTPLEHVPPRPTLPVVTSPHVPPPTLPAASSPQPSIQQISATIELYKKDNNESEMDKLAAGSSMNTEGYTNRRMKIVVDFIDFLKSDQPKYHHLTNLVVAPDHFLLNTNGMVEHVFVAFSGTEYKATKIKTLSEIMINWFGTKRLKTNKNSNQKLPYPQPGTLNVDLRAFLAATRDYYDWNFILKDFNFEGGFNGFFTKLMSKRTEEDVSTCLFEKRII